MEKNIFRQISEKLWESVPGNILREDMGIRREHVGKRMYDPPLIGFGSAGDPLFEAYKRTEVIGPWHLSPREWLPDAETVVSFFFPTNREVRESNRTADRHASDLWAYARIEGQAYIAAFMEAVAGWFRKNGFDACVPSSDPRWQKMFAGKGIEGYPEITDASFGSRWSERHAAYVCGLGTFGLSKGLITKKGMAGRFGSVVVSAVFDPDPRPYTGIYDYCIRCGACAARCPVHAIDMASGKDHTKCMECLNASGKVLAPRYGCGLCQTGVPCEDRIPCRTEQPDEVRDPGIRHDPLKESAVGTNQEALGRRETGR